MGLLQADDISKFSGTIELFRAANLVYGVWVF